MHCSFELNAHLKCNKPILRGYIRILWIRPSRETDKIRKEHRAIKRKQANVNLEKLYPPSMSILKLLSIKLQYKRSGQS